MLVENGAPLASRLRLALLVCVTTLLIFSPAFAQQPTAEPVPSRELPPLETIPPGPLDATRPTTPSAPVTTPRPPVGDVAPTIVVPPPTVPSAQRPSILGPSGTTAPAAVFQPHFGISATEEYSDNFFLESRRRRDNFRSILSPSVGLDINGAFTKGQLGYTLSATHDTVDSSDEIQIFHSFSGIVTWRATPLLTLGLSDTLVRSDEPTQADRLSLRQERDTFLTNTLTATAQYLLGRVTTGASYSYSTFLSSREGNTNSHTFGANAGTSFYDTNNVSLSYEYLLSKTTSDRSTTSGGSGDEEINGHRVLATYARRLTTLTSAGITGSYAIRRSDARHDDSNIGSGVARGNDYDTWSVSLFNSYAGPRLSMAGSVGYSRIEPKDGGDSSSTVTTATNIAYRFARAIVSLSLDSGFSETFAEGQNFGVVETRGAQLSLYYPVTPFFTTLVSGFYRENTGATNSDDQHTWGVNASGTFQLTRWLSLILEYVHRESSGGTIRSATGFTGGGGTGTDYTENRGRLSLSAAF